MRPIFLAIVLLLGSAAQAVEPLTPQEWRADIAALESGVAGMHPAPFHSVSEADFSAAADRLAARADEASEAEMIAGLTELVAMLGEGHSRLVVPLGGFGPVGAGHREDEAPRIAPLAYIPAQPMLAGEEYVVIRADADHAGLIGARIVSIDGVPIAEAASRIAPLVNADSPAERVTRIGDFLMVPALLRARGFETGRRWELAKPSGETVTVELPEMREPVEWQGSEPYPDPPADAQSPVNWVVPLGDGRVLLRLGEIGDQEDIAMTGLAQATAALLGREEDPALIVDLRGNPGGDNSQIDALVRTVIRDERLFEPGRLFVLIDGRTHSAAVNLANQLDRWTPAIFVGSPTAASPNSYGDARPLELPNSGLSARISTLYWQDSGPMDERASISPEIAAPFTQAAIAAGRDPALDMIAAIIAAPPGAPGRFTGNAAMFGHDVGVTIELSGDSPTLAIPGLIPEPVALEALRIGEDGAVQATISVAGATIPLRALILGDRLLGHVSVRGRIYALALHRDGPPTAH
ncbi:MAG: hypothetical protein ABR601_05865 [Parasphingopyxis sp.]|nr:hypothetical protein [Sphingomonadales bacterium]